MGDPRDRLTVVESIYHRTGGNQPFQVQSRYSRPLQTSEQAYQRRQRATSEWQPLDCGWIGDDVGMLVIANEEGKDRQTIPTAEEAATLATRILEVSYAIETGPATNHKFMGWLIHPGESMRGVPTDAKELYIRCLSGRACYLLTLIPK